MLDIDELRFNLRENDSEFFSELELEALLDKNDRDVSRASFEGLLIKAEDDSIALPGGLQVPSNRAYWLGLAKRFRKANTRTLQRADRC